MGSAVTLVSFIITWSIIFLSLVNSYTGCPSVCTCKWKNGKQTAECVGQGLTVIPAELKVGTQVIDLSRNNFHTITNNVFQAKGLVNLQKIFLGECGISSVAPDAFFQLSNLIELDLSRNKLSDIPTEALRHCSHLRRLQLAHNPIKHINEGALASLLHLIFLDLSNCEIETVQPGGFSGLKSLEFLKLDGNQLGALSVKVVEPLTQLSGLHLHSNPWYCDCNIRDVRKWMLDQNIPLAVPPHCADPIQVKGTTWDMMSLEDFACPPNIIEPPSREINVAMGLNASILCQVDSNPKASVYWEVGGRHLTNLTSNPEYRGKYNIEADESSRQSSRLTVISTVETDNDIYTCVAENKAGNSSINFTLSVVSPNPYDGSWSNTQITIVLVGIFLAIAIVVAVVCGLILHPVTLTTGAKVSGVSVLKHLTSKKQDAVEINDISCHKEEKEFKTSDKQPRHETGSSGYGSDQLTPDLVSKIVDMNNGPSLSTSTVSCNHPDPDNAIASEGYGQMVDNWSAGKPKSPRYDDSPGRNIYSEIYPNPCYGKDDSDCYMMQSPTLLHYPDFHVERNVPLNNRVRTLRGCFGGSGSTTAEGVRDDLCINSASSGTWKRAPLGVSNNVSHYTLPTKARFSPDEGYAEDALEGTEV